MIHGTAMQRIKIGASVLIRGDECRLASPEIANAVAVDDGWTPKAYREGEWVKARPIEGLGERCLHAIANGPIMDANRIYLPAGKVSDEEVRRREAWQEGVD